VGWTSALRALASYGGVMPLDLWYNCGYTLEMKTAISIPDQIFTAAEQTAKRLGISRSELYASAVRDYIESHVSEEITEKLNQVYSAQDSSLDSSLQSMQSSSIGKEDW
jgi:hypothetical protein